MSVRPAANAHAPTAATAPATSTADAASSASSSGITSTAPSAAPSRSTPYARPGGNPARVSASVSVTPTTVNGSASTSPSPSSATKPIRSVTGSSGPDIVHASAGGASSAKHSAESNSRRGTSANTRGHRNTITAPAVIPSIASAITKNAR
jgi:hypothetical protein